ncbi:indole-3-glycerol phosphate synthase TrpC [Pseudalkalibacillus hwajinpoensis]|uniref:indole-3-glycerol phosphate synthase TrpC n=1 Tax=Guptibacillus hwajinpoensis TaxID=208199 RepID=UPI001CD2E4F6|nr:indole-3-glycerol phosphate synthase TrpC [Pseudalkalibacillus hwajinpoensis]MCA0990776.1 indole-3-glycerol phosphate synthase TrpC [Pseudalkalibacillus hwajinpoensis]
MLDQIIKVKHEEMERFIMPDDEKVTNVSFVGSLRKPTHELGLIAEVKKASPSKGIINANFDPVEVAKAYEKAGADAVSVLTDESFFMGANSFLTEVKKHVSLPVLRKDFIIDKRQIEESKRIGADAILLIVRALGATKTKEFYDYASNLGLECLVEVHSKEELEALTDHFTPEVIGINNRNLATFETSTKQTHSLSQYIPQSTLMISESGISTYEDIKDVKSAGAKAVLVGEALMRDGTYEKGIKHLFGETVHEKA